MGQVPSGRISYKRTIQTAPYESATAEVDLALVFDEDEDVEETLANSLELAKDAVYRKLGIKRKKAGRDS